MAKRRRANRAPTPAVSRADHAAADPDVPPARRERAGRPTRLERLDAAQRARRRRGWLRSAIVVGAIAVAIGVFAVASGVGQPDLGVAARSEGGVNVHLEQGAPLPQTNRPPSSGPHYGGRATYGVTTTPVPAGNWLHAIEHGAIAVLFRCSDDAECGGIADRLRTEVWDRARDGAYGERKLVITPYDDMDTPVAAVAWGRVLELPGVDAEQILAFYDRYLDRGPERAP
jgi:hypothetical protein